MSLIVHLDKEGVWYFSNDAPGYISAFPIQTVDTIGAGDSHAGDVFAGPASGLLLADTVLLGNAMALQVVGHRGSDCVSTREELFLAHKNVQIAAAVADAVLNRPLLLIKRHLFDHQHRYFAI